MSKSNPWERSSQPQATVQPNNLSIQQPVATPAPQTAANAQTVGQTPAMPPMQQVITPIPPMTNGPKVKVALLVPLSGNSAEIGEAISNAAQMALFDTGADSFELIPRDTHGTAAGAAAAAQSAVQDGARLILGPLLADEVHAVAPIIQAANINMVAFTTDWKQAGSNTFVMGFVPFGQVQRVLSFAASKGIHSIGVVAPQSDYGNAIMSVYDAQAQAYGLQTMDIIRTRPGDPGLSPAIQKFSRMDNRKRGDGTIAPAPFDAVFLPASGTDLQTIANLLTYYDLDPKTVRRLGTGLWDDPTISRETNLNGGWFAAPDPSARKVFEQKYRDIYGMNPPRLASLGYDATALAAVLAKTGHSGFDRAAITNPNGFSGIDGIFRFRNDGLAERGLAILELQGGQPVVIDPAPRTFQNGAQ
jgi:branched-chain amino acid transport system substrate-binding protein